MKRLLLVLRAALLVLIAATVYRAWLGLPKQLVVAPAERINLDEMGAITRLAQAVRLPTISHHDPRQTDFSQLLKLHALLKKQFPKVHTHLKREVIGDYSLLYEWTGEDPSLAPMLLLAHMDVVPISPGTEKEWEQPPFAGKIADGFLWGRGTLDDKSAVLGILEAAEWLLAHEFKPKRTLYFGFGHDEEVGGKAGAKHIAAHLSSHGIRPELILDEGGVVSENMVPGVSKPVALIGIAEKGFTSIEMTTVSGGGHSSMPPLRTAIGALSEAVRRLEQHQMTASLKGATREMLTTLAPEMGMAKRYVLANLWLFGPLVLSGLQRVPETNAGVRTTTAPTIFQSGDKDNVLPIKALATINFRILPGDNQEKILEHMRRVINDRTIELKPISYFPPSSISDVNAPSFQFLKRTVRRIFPEAVVSPYLTVASTDTRHFGDISSNVYRFIPARFYPKDPIRVHGTNERIPVKDYADMIRFYVDLVREGTAH